MNADKLKKEFFTLGLCTVGLFLGKALWLWYDAAAHPERYAMYSAPWYFQLLPGLAMLAAALILEGVLYAVLKQRMDQNK